MSSILVPPNARAAQQAILDVPHPLSATLPVPNATHSFWIDHLDDRHQTPGLLEGSEGDLTNDADVCIIGSGITGVSAAYHLATQSEGPKLKVLILEAREFCSGATGRNGGHLAPHAFLGFRHQHTKYGISEATRSVEIERYTSARIRKILDDSGKTHDVDLVAKGRVVLFFTPDEELAARADYDAANVSGVDLTGVRWFTRGETQELYGTPYPAVLIPANNLWPHKLVSVLYNLAASTPDLDLILHTKTPVTAISPASEGRRWQLHTPRGVVTCHTVLHATNGYASHLLPFMHNEIVPTRGQIIALRANTSFPFGRGREGFTANDGSEYWFPRPKGRHDDEELVILGGGRHAAVDGMYQFFETDDSVVDANVGAFVRAFLPGVFPGRFAKGREPEMEWTGIMGYTKIGDPFVGPLNDLLSSTTLTGQYISAGYTGHGMPRAFACAEVVAAMILAEMSRKEMSTLPEWFPVHYLTANRTL